MQTLAKKTDNSRAAKMAKPPLRLKTRAEARKYLAEHLTPVEYGPKGQPIYALEEIQALNVIFPEDL
jgi:hypothetical protein